MQDRDDRSTLLGIQILPGSAEDVNEVGMKACLVSMPCSRRRSSLGLSIANDSDSDSLRLVHDTSVRHSQAVSKLSTFVYRTRCLSVDLGMRQQTSTGHPWATAKDLLT